MQRMQTHSNSHLNSIQFYIMFQITACVDFWPRDVFRGCLDAVRHTAHLSAARRCGFDLTQYNIQCEM